MKKLLKMIMMNLKAILKNRKNSLNSILILIIWDKAIINKFRQQNPKKKANYKLKK